MLNHSYNTKYKFGLDFWPHVSFKCFDIIFLTVSKLERHDYKFNVIVSNLQKRTKKFTESYLHIITSNKLIQRLINGHVVYY